MAIKVVRVETSYEEIYPVNWETAGTILLDEDDSVGFPTFITLIYPNGKSRTYEGKE